MSAMRAGCDSCIPRGFCAAVSAPQPRSPPYVPICVSANGWSNMLPPISSTTATIYSTSRQISCGKTLRRAAPTRNGTGTSLMSGHVKGGSIWLESLICFLRHVVGWAISHRMKQDLALRTLNMATAIRRPPPGCVHHTDRGSHSCAHDYQKLLCKHRFKVSMSGKDNCYDNSAVESFFRSLTAELVWRRNWQTRRQVEVALFEYINGFYDPRRRHSALGWKSPLAFEQRAA